ncbi:hypothetical protein MBLNU459_g1462t2 [Dothideomycetes sp. NU459]
MTSPVTAVALISLVFFVLRYLNRTDTPKIKNLPEIPGIPLFGNLLQLGSHHAKVAQGWAKQYGPVFQTRLGNRRIVFANSFEAVKTLWITNQSSLISRPTLHTFHTVVSSSEGFTIGTSPWDESCKARRKAAATALNRPAVQSYMPFIDFEATRSIKDMLVNSKNGEVDLDPNPYFQRYALSTSLTLNYGLKIEGSIDDEMLKEITHVEREINMLKERIANGTDKPCITGNILKDPDTKLNDAEIMSICLTMVSAGLDTVPGNLVMCIAYLSSEHGQEIQKHALEEINKIYPEHDSWERCLSEEKVDYITALVKEVLRYWTVIPICLPRVSIKDIKWRDATIPAGTTFYMNAYAADYDPDHFDSPLKFNPDRYLADRSSSVTGTPHYGYGAGSRMCVGSHLANRELYTAFLRIITAFEIVPPKLDSDRPVLDSLDANAIPTGLTMEPKPFKVGIRIPLRDNAPVSAAAPPYAGGYARQLHGRFLQITDFHPDRFFETYSSTAKDAACHRGSGPAGFYGAETSECDSPVALINATFDWIASELKDSIDFVVWTGDSARHDNDEELPRSTEQVVQLNELLVQKVVEVFGKNDNDDDDDPTNDLIIPVVPTFGNNDILPHNIFERGPNRWTKQYLSIWKKFIPEEQRHQFDQGGWFSVEVIPNRLTVFSLNSLYFFDSNSAVDGCAAKSEPGYRQLEWLRIQLQFLRDRQMKAIIIGHVPPARTENKQSWDETCWQKYALWMRQYRDIVVGSVYGHMNLDHFMLQDFEDIHRDVQDGYEIVNPTNKRARNPEDDLLHAEASGNYLVDLRDSWSKLPKPPSREDLSFLEQFDKLKEISDDAQPEWEIDAVISKDIDASKNGRKGGKGKKPHTPEDYLKKIGGLWGERFSVSHAAPSVVPNYFPTIRVYEYNVTGLGATSTHDSLADQLGAWLLEALTVGPDQVEINSEGVEAEDLQAERKKKKKKPKKRRFHVPEPPSKSAPPGPAYSPQTLSLLGYTQYFANLTHINNDFDSSAVDAESVHSLSNHAESQKWKEGKHHGKRPHDKDQKPHPKKFTYEVLYNTRDEDDMYKLTDMSVRHYLDLARRIGKFKPEKETSQVEQDAESTEDFDDDDEKSGRQVEILDKGKKGKKGKKGGKKKKKHHKKPRAANRPWYTFVKRAFVGTIDMEEIEDQFGGRNE